MILLALAKTERTRDHSSINTQRTTIIFSRLLPSTTLLPRGEIIFHLPIITILEIFKDFFACKLDLAANHQQPEGIQRLSGQQKQSTAATSNHPASSIPAATSNHPPSSIPAATSNHPATTSSNQQQQPAAATSSSNQQQQQAAATNSSNQQQ